MYSNDIGELKWLIHRGHPDTEDKELKASAVGQAGHPSGYWSHIGEPTARSQC